ncbi:uncharacterized protein EKO05_0010573 [Ascochyta rabiei]|uniref:uncharacterized protein n=1 Tax=Didymella rabiei TaxID=5454 RepID=UPI00220B1B43|nr:uncharacterized protein EKO05_0010573 [Ascochyta rabiei]UPX20338.1 hypothetical protein EKO05_0010573 [Ascochyta rabiei]
MNRWLDRKTRIQLLVDAAVQALRCKDTELFQCIYQHIEDRSREATSRIEWETLPTFGIVKEFLHQPVLGDLGASTMQWDFVFRLERYYAEGDCFLWISQSLPVCADNVGAV